MKLRARILTGLLAVAGFGTSTVFVNCSGFEYKRHINRHALFSQKLFPSYNPESDPTDLFTNPAPLPETSGSLETSPPPEDDYNGGVKQPPTIFKAPTHSHCSNDISINNGGNVEFAKDKSPLTVMLTDPSQNSSYPPLVCQFEALDTRETLLNEGRLVIYEFNENCPNLKPGKYLLTMRMKTKIMPHYGEYSGSVISYNEVGSAPFWELNQQAVPVTVTIDNEGRRIINEYDSNSPLTVLLAPQMQYNGPISPVVEGPVTHQYSYKSFCNQDASPLVIQLTENPQKIQLTAPLKGIRYDILGERSVPAHSPHRISWFSPRSSVNNFFLTLPNYNGEVNGVDQLFGDNTLGPDGKFAANGYEALRKWDHNRDGLITNKDPVFRLLRLWTDSNGNGRVENGEMFSLDQKKVVSIDLNYDAGYKEVDRYGNKIMMKSVATTSDGHEHIMYDIWFRLIPGE